jgi:hypothetical protein
LVSVTQQIFIHPLSVVPLHLEVLRTGTTMGFGTGYIVVRAGVRYLVTNGHVVTGRDPSTGQPILASGTADPDSISIWHHAAGQLGAWTQKIEPLLDPKDGAPKWREHPEGRKIDVVALPLTQESGIDIYPLDLQLAHTDLLIQPSEPVSIIGFPLGLAAAGKVAIWKTGHVASDIDLNYNDQPIFLIDATTKPGMSGSPVVALRVGAHRSSQAALNVDGEATRFLGTYSGRIRDQADVGMVWKPPVLEDILPSDA